MIRISSRDIKKAQRQQEEEVGVVFRLNNDGDIVAWRVDAGSQSRQAVGQFLADKLGYPPHNLSK